MILDNLYYFVGCFLMLCNAFYVLNIKLNMAQISLGRLSQNTYCVLSVSQYSLWYCCTYMYSLNYRVKLSTLYTFVYWCVLLCNTTGLSLRYYHRILIVPCFFLSISFCVAIHRYVSKYCWVVLYILYHFVY